MPCRGRVATKGEQGLLKYADELCKSSDRIPTDVSGLETDVIELYQTFTKSRTRPFILACGRWTEPDRSWANPSKLTKPKTMRVLMMNLGEKNAANINVRLRNPKEKGGNVFVQGTVNISGKSVDIAVLPVIAKWQVWKTWDIEVDGEGCEVLIYPRGDM